MARGKQLKKGEQTVSLESVSAFMRQLAHDLHNDLNALDLAATYIGEIIDEVSAKEELGMQRETIHSMSGVLHKLSLYLQPPHPEKITVSAADLTSGFRDRLLQFHPVEADSLSWSVEVGASLIAVDFEMISMALTEVFKNAFLYHDPGTAIEFSARVKAGKLRFRFTENKATPPESMNRLGHEPFIEVNRRSYGLGLFYATRVAGAHGGGLELRHDAERGLFIVEISIPVKAEKKQPA